MGFAFHLHKNSGWLFLLMSFSVYIKGQCRCVSFLYGENLLLCHFNDAFLYGGKWLTRWEREVWGGFWAIALLSVILWALAVLSLCSTAACSAVLPSSWRQHSQLLSRPVSLISYLVIIPPLGGTCCTFLLRFVGEGCFLLATLFRKVKHLSLQLSGRLFL